VRCRLGFVEGERRDLVDVMFNVGRKEAAGRVGGLVTSSCGVFICNFWGGV
jgi:hypothetical protein